MQEIRRIITEEQYNEYKKMDYCEMTKAVESTLSTNITCGYGYYGCRLAEDDKGYYLCLTIGSSCD